MTRIVVVGSINVDLVLRIRSSLQPGETQLALSTQRHPGGKGANQAVAAARLGGAVWMVGAVGDDEAGTFLANNLAANGVKTDLVRTLPIESGQAFIASALDGQNSIIVASGANALVTPEHVDALAGLLATGDVLVCQLEIPLDTVRAAFAIARSSGALTVLNAAPAADIGALGGLVDVLIVNESEAAFLLNRPVDQTNLATISCDLRTVSGVPLVVATLGSAGVVGSDSEGTFSIDAESVEVVDTTGAGDTFVGAFAWAKSAAFTDRDAVDLANRAAALSCTRMGAQEGMPTQQDVYRGTPKAQR